MEKSARAYNERLLGKSFSTKAIGKAVGLLLKDFGLSTGEARLEEFFYSKNEKKYIESRIFPHLWKTLSLKSITPYQNVIVKSYILGIF